MKRIAALVVLCLIAGTGMGATFDGSSPGEPAPPPAEPVAEPPDVSGITPDPSETLAPYAASAGGSALTALADAGVDMTHVSPTTAPDGSTAVEVVLSPQQATDLAQQGVALEPNQVDPAASPAPGGGVFRPYSGEAGIQAEFAQLAADHRDITKLVSIGQSVQGQDIVALKVTQRARTIRDGRRPAVLYMSEQHANERIAPEMVRRLARHLVEGYG